MESPFKFLDAYTLEDKEVFFGREKETNALYSMVYKSPLILIYGLSGTGKTSLVQCGLAGRFDGPDWFPFYIRRQENINVSLFTALDQVIDEEQEDELNLLEKISSISASYFRPVYLIFDQFEELFILGSEEEKQAFASHLSALLEAELPCKIILVIREEYLGRLYDLEKVIPSIFDHQLRVEPMNNVKVAKVMTASFEKFNITLEAPEQDRLQEMIDNLSGEKSGIQLPYLQVYLDLLYREDYQRTYGNKNLVNPPLEFTRQEIATLGKIEDVLDRFLSEQKKALQAELEVKFDEKIPSDTVHLLIDAFVTEEGTKRPVYYSREEDIFQLNTRAKELMPPISSKAMTFCLEGLEKRRILRFTDSSIELAHDSLAHLIDQKRTDEQRLRNEVLRSIKNNYAEHKKTQEYLTENQLILYKDFLPLFQLDQPILEYIENSREHVETLKKEERLQQQREIEIAQERIAAKRQRILLWIIGVLAVFTTVAGISFFFQRNKAVKAKIAADEAKAALAHETRDKLVETAKAFKAQGKYEEALKKLKEAEMTAINNEIDPPDSLEIYQVNWEKVAVFLKEGEAYFNQNTQNDTLVLALEKYTQAYEIDKEPFIAEKIEKTGNLIDQSYEAWMLRAERFIRYKYCNYATEALAFAKKLKPEDLKVDSLKKKLQLVNCR